MKIIFLLSLLVITVLSCDAAECDESANLLAWYSESTKFCEENSPYVINIENFKSHHFGNPTIRFQGSKPNKLYTVLILDPDAPCKKNPIFANFLHLGVANVPGEILHRGIDGEPGKGPYDVFMDYMPPTPPKGSGPHRYNVMVFEQKEHILLPRYTSRPNFNLEDFITFYNLERQGEVTFKTEDV